MQSVLACLYLHNPACIEDDTLRAFCYGALKLAGLIREKVSVVDFFAVWRHRERIRLKMLRSPSSQVLAGALYGDEDFDTSLHGAAFEDTARVSTVLGMRSPKGKLMDRQTDGVRKPSQNNIILLSTLHRQTTFGEQFPSRSSRRIWPRSNAKAFVCGA